MRRIYELREPRMKPCPRCEGEGSWLIARATHWDPEEWGYCEECDGTGEVSMKVNVYRKNVRVTV